jgi:hypothetical protein
VTVLAAARTAEGEHWALVLDDDGVPGATVAVDVTGADGRRFWGIGCGLAALAPGEQVVTTVGSDDAGPATLILQLCSDVRAAVVTLSDGTREDLVLHRLPGRDDRAAVLVHPRRLDVRRVDLYAADGSPL